MPLLTLTIHTPIEPMKVTQPAIGHLSSMLPSATVTTGLMPSFRLKVATADAGIGPVTRTALPTIAARPTAITALVSFINPPWPTSCPMNSRWFHWTTSWPRGVYEADEGSDGSWSRGDAGQCGPGNRSDACIGRGDLESE